ncbi:hypothetical protein Hanom_Chr14g01318281 [Helianthus anomalus]
MIPYNLKKKKEKKSNYCICGSSYKTIYRECKIENPLGLETTLLNKVKEAKADSVMINLCRDLFKGPNPRNIIGIDTPLFEMLKKENLKI